MCHVCIISLLSRIVLRKSLVFFISLISSKNGMRGRKLYKDVIDCSKELQMLSYQII